MKLLQPLRGNFIVTQTFQEHVQRALENHWKNYNGGIDWGCLPETPVYAAIDGPVAAGLDPNGYGVHAKQYDKQSTPTYTVVYGHLTKVENSGMLKAGDLIGYSGNTGNSTGPHLHFETRKLGKPFDPMPYLVPLSDVGNAGNAGNESTPEQAPAFQIPTFPASPQVEVLVDMLNIRTAPMGADIGDCYKGERISVLGAKQIGQNTWLEIGYSQWIAAVYQGDIYVRWL